MPITQVLLTTGAAGTPQNLGYYLYNDGNLDWAGFSDPVPLFNDTYQFPNGWNGQQWTFNGTTQYMHTQLGTELQQVYLNIWFYPTALGTILMTVQDSLTENSGYTHSAIEIKLDATVQAGLWNGGSITSITTTEKVMLNAWNHIYLKHDGTTMTVELNGSVSYTQTFNWGYPSGNCVFGFGTYSGTRMNAYSRYNGRMADFAINSTNTASNYDSLKNKYQYTPTIYLDANNPVSFSLPAGTSGHPTTGYGGSLAIFEPQDFTSGSLASVQVGWTVADSGTSGWTATVIEKGLNGYPGWIRLDKMWSQVTPYKYYDPAASAGSTWYDISGYGNNVTLYNSPAHTNTGPNYFTFSPASLQWGKIAPIGDLNWWTVETWVNLTAGLNTTDATAVITTVFDDTDPGGQGAINRINWGISNDFNSGGYTSLRAGQFQGYGWAHPQYGTVPQVGTWVHITATFDGRMLRHYTNGVFDSRFDLGSINPAIANGGAIRIARRWDGLLNAVGNYFPGKIATIKVYREARNETEILAAYNSTKATYGL